MNMDLFHIACFNCPLFLHGKCQMRTLLLGSDCVCMRSKQYVLCATARDFVFVSSASSSYAVCVFYHVLVL